MMNDKIRSAVIVLIFIVVLAGYYLIWVNNPATSGGTDSSGDVMKVGEPAPDFTISAIDGQEITLSDYIGEKAVVLDFWGTHCPPCLRELPVLQEFYEEYSGDVEILAITSQDISAAGLIEEEAGRLGITFPVIHDQSKRISRMYPTRSIPYLVFIDKDGVIVGDHLGYDTKIGERILDEFGM